MTVFELFAHDNFLGPDTVSGFVPGGPGFVELSGQASVALADGTGAVGSPFVLVGHIFPPFVSADDVSLRVIVFVPFLESQFERISGFLRLTFPQSTVEHASELLFGASVAEPELLAGLIGGVYWSTFTGHETVGAFGKAPAAVETVS